MGRESDIYAEDRISSLQRENAALRELLNVYNLGGWTDAERLIRERDAARSREQALLNVLQEAVADLMLRAKIGTFDGDHEVQISNGVWQRMCAALAQQEGK